jgi:hypothetical protein
MKKTFLLLMLGSPFPWIEQLVENFQHLEKDGWYLKIFTPNNLTSKGNVEFVPMTADQFNELVEKKIGVKPGVWITPSGIPSKHVTDYMVAHGAIFEDYIEDVDYWGHVGADNVFGDLSKFIPDSVIQKYDIWTDDTGAFNGNFFLIRNDPISKNLFRHIPNWEKSFQLPDCPRCTGTGTEHTLDGTDEYGMTDVLRQGMVSVGYPYPYFLHSHDRLIQHVGGPYLEMREGSLWEIFRDVAPPQWIHARPFIGREIPYLHFCTTKKWPL